MDVMKRRRTSTSSGFGQHLLPSSYQESHHHTSRSRLRDGSGNHRQIVISSYTPPNAQAPVHHRKELESFSNYQRDNINSLLYLSTPTPISSIRRLKPQTPSQTMLYDPPQHYSTEGPAYDHGSNSFFSYGCCCIQCVRTTEVGILENFGRFEALLEPGLHCLPWPLVDITGRLSLRIRQVEIVCETKTSDSVFCNVVVTLQFRVIIEKAYDAYYRLTDPTNQIRSYVFDVIRSKVPKMSLDEVFSSKKDIAIDVRKQLEDVLKDYGYEIIDSLLTDVRPVDSVVQSMNEINAAKRMKLAMVYRAEAEKIQYVKAAEAHCESLYLHGVGVSNQRLAIAKEMKNCIQSSTLEGYDQNDVITLLLMTQYMDTISLVGSNPEHTSFLSCVGPEHPHELKIQLKMVK